MWPPRAASFLAQAGRGAATAPARCPATPAGQWWSDVTASDSCNRHPGWQTSCTDPSQLPTSPALLWWRWKRGVMETWVHHVVRQSAREESAVQTNMTRQAWEFDRRRHMLPNSPLHPRCPSHTPAQDPLMVPDGYHGCYRHSYQTATRPPPRDARWSPRTGGSSSRMGGGRLPWAGDVLSSSSLGSASTALAAGASRVPSPSQRLLGPFTSLKPLRPVPITDLLHTGWLGPPSQELRLM